MASTSIQLSKRQKLTHHESSNTGRKRSRMDTLVLLAELGSHTSVVVVGGETELPVAATGTGTDEQQQNKPSPTPFTSAATSSTSSSSSSSKLSEKTKDIARETAGVDLLEQVTHIHHSTQACIV